MTLLTILSLPPLRNESFFSRIKLRTLIFVKSHSFLFLLFNNRIFCTLILFWSLHFPVHPSDSISYLPSISTIISDYSTLLPLYSLFPSYLPSLIPLIPAVFPSPTSTFLLSSRSLLSYPFSSLTPFSSLPPFPPHPFSSLTPFPPHPFSSLPPFPPHPFSSLPPFPPYPRPKRRRGGGI